MRRFVYTCVLLLLSLVSCSVANYATTSVDREIVAYSGFEGTLETVSYPSSEPGLSTRRMIVYLPKDYYRDSLRRYPVLYLLHGARGNDFSWINRAKVLSQLDSLRAEGKAEDFILVLPNMNRYYNDRDYKNGAPTNAWRSFWRLNGEAERYFVQDVVARTDSMYRTVASRSSRAIAGMSSGGLQTLYISATYPDLFDYVGLFSPYTYPTYAAINHSDIYGPLWRLLRQQFGNPPSVYSIYIGESDFFYPHIMLFHKKLTSKGYPHRLILSNKGHIWQNWAKYFVDFCQDIFR